MNNFYKKHGTGIYGLAFLLVLITVFIMPFIISSIKTKSFLKKEILKQAQLTQCKQDAVNDYNVYWASQCKDGTSDCTLPVIIADKINKTLEKDLDRCVSLYKTNQ